MTRMRRPFVLTAIAHSPLGPTCDGDGSRGPAERNVAQAGIEHFPDH
jgi:hypothetical protein